MYLLSLSFRNETFCEFEDSATKAFAGKFSVIFVERLISAASKYTFKKLFENEKHT